jgi:hypothetical protein
VLQKNKKEIFKMPAKNPRINIVVEPSLYAAIQDLAEKKGLSLSMLTRDLIKESLESYEDVSFSKLAEEREKTFNINTSLSHEKTWE